MNGWKKWITIAISAGLLILAGLAAHDRIIAHEMGQNEGIVKAQEKGNANETRIVAVEETVKQIPKANERLASIEAKLDLLLERIK